MRIHILQFEVKQTVPMTEHLNPFQYVWRTIFGPEIEVDYHFDIQMKIDPEYEAQARKLERGDKVQLPNGVKLEVWSIDRFNLIKAKTPVMIKEDLRGYRPMEMYLVYPRVHGHLNDRAV